MALQSIGAWLRATLGEARRFAPSGSAGIALATVPPHEASAPTLSWLDRLDRWFWRQEQLRRERYLAAASDLVELEQRMRSLERARSGGFL